MKLLLLTAGTRGDVEPFAAPPVPARRATSATLVRAIAEALGLTPTVRAAAAPMGEEHGVAGALGANEAVGRSEPQRKATS